MKRFNQFVVLLAAAALLGCDGAGRLAPADQPADATLETLARTDPLALLRLARDRYAAYTRDWSAVATVKPDGGAAGRQVIAIKLRRKPYAVLADFSAGAVRYDRMLYAAEGEGQVFLHPTGYAGGVLRSVTLSPDDPSFGDWLAFAPAKWDFADRLDELIDLGTRAERAGDLDSTWLGQVTHDGRAALALQWKFPRRGGYPAATVLVLLDSELLVPVRIHRADWTGRPVWDLSFASVRLNVGLEAGAFTPESAGLVETAPPTVLHAGPADIAPPGPEAPPTEGPGEGVDMQPPTSIDP